MKMPVPVSFYRGWKELRFLRILKLGELCGLTFTGEFYDNERPEFIGNDKCFKEFFNQLELQNLN